MFYLRHSPGLGRIGQWRRFTPTYSAEMSRSEGFMAPQFCRAGLSAGHLGLRIAGRKDHCVAGRRDQVVMSATYGAPSGVYAAAKLAGAIG